MRHVCVHLLDTAWELAVCRIIVSVTLVYRDGVWSGFVRYARLLAVVLGWVDHCIGSLVLLGVFCLLRVTRRTDKATNTWHRQGTQQNKEHLQSTPGQTTINRQNSQTKHLAPLKV